MDRYYFNPTHNTIYTNKGGGLISALKQRDISEQSFSV